MMANMLRIYLSVFTLLLPSILFAATPIFDRASYFPGVAQGHSKNCTSNNKSKLTMYNNSKIKGTNGEALAFCQKNPNGYPDDGCENGSGGYEECPITENKSSDIPLPDFKTSTSNSSYECNNGGSYTFNNPSYKNISSNKSNCSFIMNNSEQSIKKLALNGGTLTIHSGDYWIESLHIDSTSQIYIEGDVRLFVKNGLGIYNNSFIKKIQAQVFHFILIIIFIFHQMPQLKVMYMHQIILF